MSDQIVTPRCTPRRHVVRAEALSSPNSIRTYRNSPEDGILQIRLSKDYVSVTLYPAELREIAARLIAVADDIEGKSNG